MSDVAARVESFVRESFRELVRRCPPDDTSLIEQAWWEVGELVFPVVARLRRSDGRRAFRGRRDVSSWTDTGRPVGALFGMAVYLVEGDRIALKVPPGSLPDPFEDIPVFIAWDEPRRGPMCATGIPGHRPVPLAEVLQMLPHPRIGEARTIFAEAFRRGLEGALRGTT